jgi:hypothetical protein
VVGQVFVGNAKLGNAVVVVNGLVTLADADGKFRMRKVAPEYQLMIRWPGEKLLFVYDGLTTREPHVNVGAFRPSVNRMATVRGAFVNGWVAGDEPANSRKAVSYVGTQPGFSDTDMFYPRDSFEIQPQWQGEATDQGTIFALQYIYDFNLGPYDYQWFGTRQVTVTDGQVLGNTDGDAATDVTLKDPDDVSITTNVSVPDGWMWPRTTLLLGPLQIDTAVPTEAGTLVVPDVGLPMAFQMYTDGPEGSSTSQALIDLNSDLKVVARLPPTQSLPEKNATAIKEGFEFFWDNMPANSVATLNLEVGDWTIYVHTASTSAKFPDLAPLHVTLPGKIGSAWSVSASGPAATMDDGLAIEEALYGSTPGTGFVSTGNRRNFVTGD